jgi:hypothetical protein
MSRVGAVVLVTVLWSGGVATAYYPPGTLRTKISSHLKKKVCEGVIRPLTGHYTFGKIDGYVAGLCIFGADKEDAILGAGKCQEGAACHIEAYVAAATNLAPAETCNKFLVYPDCYPPFLIRKVISAKVSD